MKTIFKIIFLNLLSLITLCSCAQKPIAHWDEKTDVFTSQRYNLRWDLQDLGGWRIAEEHRLPKNMIFCAASKEDIISIAISVFDAPSNAEELIKSNDKDFVNGLIDSSLRIKEVFPGIISKQFISDSCKFLFKDAIRFGTMIYVQDSRLGTDEETPFLFGGYAFINKNKLIVPLIILPYSWVEEYGDEAINMFFERFSYINASNELVN